LYGKWHGLGVCTIDCDRGVGVKFTMDLRWQELTGVRACDGYDAQELAVYAWGATDAAGW
jgi:hypothetical protein